MLLSLASSGAEWRDDHDDGRISQMGRGPDTGRQKVYSNSFPVREWEWESEISVYCRWMRCAELVAWRPSPLTKRIERTKKRTRQGW
jgi:hypothetical protein